MAKKIKLDQELYKKAARYAEQVGYHSVDEFVEHILERELSQIDENATAKEVERKLRGLGYLA
jgi:hypothetical protein